MNLLDCCKGSQNVPSLEEYLSSIHEALGSVSTTRKQQEEQGVQGHSQLYDKFKVIKNYMRPSLYVCLSFSLSLYTYMFTIFELP